MIYVTIAQAAAVHEALRVGIDLAWEESPRVEGEPCGRAIHRVTMPPDSPDTRDWFDTVATQVEQWVSEDWVTVLAADVSVPDLNPLTPNGGRGEALLGMLILAFPEVRWMFAVARGDEAGEFVKKHGLSGLFRAEGPPLFDGSGLRNFVRQKMGGVRKGHESRKQGEDPKAEEKAKEMAYLPMRHYSAVAMDEETDYAYLHAWTAYRFGFRAQVVSRLDQAEAIFGKPKGNNDDGPCVVFEDRYLNLPDDGSGGMSKDETRRKRLPGLIKIEKLPVRVRVTAGHDNGTQGPKDTKKDTKKDTREDSKVDTEHFHSLLYKPHAGIFSVWKNAKLSTSDSHVVTGDGKTSRKSKALEFVWPPAQGDFRGDEQSSGHSSPGVLVVVARRLLNRAEEMLSDGIATVEDAVRGAVLANDALELLGGKTPTLAAEALAIKHQFELHAECQFSGVEHHLDMSERLEEIGEEAIAIAHWFRPDTLALKLRRDMRACKSRLDTLARKLRLDVLARKLRLGVLAQKLRSASQACKGRLDDLAGKFGIVAKKRTTLNISLDVVNKLVRILREYNQFDEERDCMREARRLHCALYVRKSKMGWLFWPVLKYSNFLLSSFFKFSLAILFWFMAFWGLYQWGFKMQSSKNGQADAFDYTVNTFFGVNSLTDQSVFSALVIVAGLFHLGIFLSLIYDLANRR